MPFRERPPATQQILDQGQSSGTSIGGTSFGSATCSGTMWPLLPNQVVRIWNCSLVGLPSSDGLLQLNSASIVAVLFDASGNPLGVNNIVLAGGNWPSAVINGNAAGAVLTAVGDPLIELVSGFLVAGVEQVAGGAAAFQLQAFMDVFNSDASSQTLGLILAALLSFVPRS